MCMKVLWRKNRVVRF